MLIPVIDFETTGVEADDEPVEMAVVMVDTKIRRPVSMWSSLIKPRVKEICPAAMGTHHITPDMIEHAPTLDEVWLSKDRMEAVGSVAKQEYCAAHVAEFDSRFIPGIGPWICTYRCARAMIPEADPHGFKNQTLRYYLGLPHPVSNLPPHRALPDALVTAELLCWLLQHKTPKELLKVTQTPFVHRGAIRFGKHEGTLWSEMPHDYLRWMLRNDFDADTHHTCRHYLGLA